MKVLGVVGQSREQARAAIEVIADRLSSRGRVATVTALDDESPLGRHGLDVDGLDGSASVTAVCLGEERWIATGDARTVDEALADLAPDHDYALVAGPANPDRPTVVLGDVAADGHVLAAAPTVADLDVDTVLDGIDDVEPFVTLGSLVAEAKRSEQAARAGAIATFTGRVREWDDPDDEPTEYLEFERYDEVAEARLETIRSELAERDGVYEVLAYHKTGVVEAGEDIVFVVVLAGHREEAFRTVSDGIDRLKAEVPLFKKEVTVDDEFWRHERPSG